MAVMNGGHWVQGGPVFVSGNLFFRVPAVALGLRAARHGTRATCTTMRSSTLSFSSISRALQASALTFNKRWWKTPLAV